MTTRPAPRWRRLAPVALGVAVLHAALLQADAPSLPAPGLAAPASFRTRSVTPAPTVLAVPLPAATAAPAPPRPRPVATGAAARRAQRPAALAPAETAPRSEPVLLAQAPAAPDAAPEAGRPPAAEPPPAAADLSPPLSLLPPARLHYEVVAQARGFTVHGEAELAWRHDGHAYEAQLALQSPLLRSRVQRSVGHITAEGLAPDVFSDRSRGEQATHFDREQGRVVFSNNRPQAALVPGLQDRLSVLLQLAALVAGDPARYPRGTQIVLPTAGTREAEEWVFRAEGEEALELPGGSVAAVKLQRLPRREYDQRVELWLAPGMAYAPVRLRLTNPNGDWVDQRWSSTDRS